MSLGIKIISSSDDHSKVAPVLFVRPNYLILRMLFATYALYCLFSFSFQLLPSLLQLELSLPFVLLLLSTLLLSLHLWHCLSIFQGKSFKQLRLQTSCKNLPAILFCAALCLSKPPQFRSQMLKFLFLSPALLTQSIKYRSFQRIKSTEVSSSKINLRHAF